MASTQTRSKRRNKDPRRRARDNKRSRSGKAAPEDGKPQKGTLREWLDALVFALVVMIVLRLLFFDLFRIPTPSMEKNLLVGDYLFVSKLHYGTRTPMTAGIPFYHDWHVPGLELPYYRFPGFSEVKRGDALVFNWPNDDLSKPIDRRTHYIKRVIGLPGETIEVRDKVVHVNGEAVPANAGMQQQWLVFKKDDRYRLPRTTLEELGLTLNSSGTNPVTVNGTAAAVEQLRGTPYVDRIEPAIANSPAAVAYYTNETYPPGRGYTPDQFGPITIPKGGTTVTLTDENWPVVEPVIRKYEGHTTQRQPDGTFLIEGQPATTYTFAQDYFFVMGDNRDNSEDSRFWGFVPMDHVVGKAILVYFSWDWASSVVPRFSRIFTIID